MFFECVGADNIRPVVFPVGKQRRRKRRQFSIEPFKTKFGSIMSKHGIFATLEPLFGQYGSAQKLPRWRADDIRYVIV